MPHALLWSWNELIINNKMQRLSFDFVDVNFFKFKYRAGIEDRIYIHFATMWTSVNGNVLTNQIDIRSAKTHEMTRWLILELQVHFKLRKKKFENIYS